MTDTPGLEPVSVTHHQEGPYSWTETRYEVPAPEEAPTMTRAEIADAVSEGRMSITEAEAADPSLKGVRQIVGISQDEAQRRTAQTDARDVLGRAELDGYTDEEFDRYEALENDTETPEVFDHTDGIPQGDGGGNAVEL